MRRFTILALIYGTMQLGCGGARAESAPAMGPPAPPMKDFDAEISTSSASPIVGPRDASNPSDLAEKKQGGNGATSGGPRGESPAEIRRVMLDIEANFTLETKEVAASSDKLRALTKTFGGYVVSETTSGDQYSPPQAQFTLRVPAKEIERFFSDLEALGLVRAKTVQAKDIGKEYFDAELRLRHLEQTQSRYEELLAQARTVEETMAVESRLQEVRERIESLKGELRWYKDRAAQATVHVTFITAQSVVSPYEEPTASLYPGLRFGYARNIGGSFEASDFVGAGLSVRFSRNFSIDVEGLPTVTSGYGGEDVDLFLATLGGELYSDFLGGGRRRFLNPYLGARLGYARFLRLNQMAVGGVLGVELVKTPMFSIDLDGRGYVLFLDADGAHALLEPALSANIAF